MISSAGKAPTCPRHRKPILPLITGLGQLVLSRVPTPHPAIFLTSIRHTGHKYFLFSKPISLIAVKNITGLNFKNLCYFLEGKQIIVVISIRITFAFLRSSLSASAFKPIFVSFVAIDYLSKSSLVLFVFSLVVCLFAFVVFFPPPFTLLFQQNEKLFYLHVYIECRDNFHNCETWRRSGLCRGTAHAFYLRNGCAKTCGFCKSK